MPSQEANGAYLETGIAVTGIAFGLGHRVMAGIFGDVGLLNVQLRDRFVVAGLLGCQPLGPPAEHLEDRARELLLQSDGPVRGAQ
jgi:hypothetical protein